MPTGIAPLQAQSTTEDDSVYFQCVISYWYTMISAGMIPNGYWCVLKTFNCLHPAFCHAIGTLFTARMHDLDPEYPLPHEWLPSNIQATFHSLLDATSSLSVITPSPCSCLLSSAQHICTVFDVADAFSVESSDDDDDAADAADLVNAIHRDLIAALGSDAAPANGTAPLCFLCRGAHVVHECPDLTSHPTRELISIRRTLQCLIAEATASSAPWDFW